MVTKEAHMDIRSVSPLPVYLKPWAVVFIALLTCLAASICLFKVQPIIPVLMNDLSIGEARAGTLMAVFSFSGIFLAVPGAILIRRIGIYASGGLAVVCLIAGALVGLASGVYAILLFGRLIEGIGMALLSIIGIMAVALVFPPEKRGAPMGIMCLYVSLGELATLNAAPHVAEAWGWQGVWWWGVIFCVAMLALWLVTFKQLEKRYGEGETEEETKPSLRLLFANKRVWILLVAYTLFMLPYTGVFVFWPTYLTSELGYGLALAASLVSLISFINIPSSFLSGMVSDKLGSRRGVIFFAMLICAGSYFFIPGATGALLMVLLVLVGIFCIAIPTVTYAVATEIVDDPGLGGVVVSLITVGQNMGLFLGPVLMGILIERFSWPTAFRVMACLAALGAVVMVWFRTHGGENS